MSVLFMRRLNGLLTTTALLSLPSVAGSQDCVTGGDVNCRGDIAVSMPAGANTELSSDTVGLGSDGFEISVDGAPVAQDGTISGPPRRRTSVKRQQDVALERADIAVRFDGLDVQPRLALGTTNTRPAQPGESVTLVNQMNYPAFVTRGELRITEVDARGRARVVRSVAVPPNGQVIVQAADANTTRYYSYRVYDARGRYDETQPLTLGDMTGRGTPVIAVQDGTAVEEGIDTTFTSRIPVSGGAVTVSGTNAGAGRRISTLGEDLRADDSGRFVLQRILPTGDHLVNVDVAGGQQLARDITIPSHELFYVGIIDLTVHRSLQDDLQDATGEPYDRTTERGRVAFYLKGKVRGDVLLTVGVCS